MLYEAWPVWNPCPSPENGKTLEEKALEEENLGGGKPWRRKPLERKTSQDFEDLEVCILQSLSVQGSGFKLGVPEAQGQARWFWSSGVRRPRGPPVAPPAARPQKSPEAQRPTRGTAGGGRLVCRLCNPPLKVNKMDGIIGILGLAGTLPCT